MEKNNGWIKDIFIHLGLVILSSIVFSVSFPNLLFEKGIPFFAWFAYIPLLFIIRKYNLPACVGWGAVYGFAAYGLFNYWLGAFHPLAGLIVYSIYVFFLAIVFLFLKLADMFFKTKAYLVQWIIWLSYEYLCTKGFLGYPYGITGYSQWQIIPLIQIAGITGIWGVSALVTFPSFWLGGAFLNDLTSGNINQKGEERTQRKDGNKSFKLLFTALGSFCCGLAVNFFRKERISAIIWAVLLAASLVFGFINMKDFSSYPKAQIALIQHNTDPWEASKAPTDWTIYEAYRKDLEKLTRLSDEALASHPKPQLVVWPETAFVPRIYWHTTYRDDQSSWRLVKALWDYLAAKDVPFLIGNDDARMDPSLNPNQGEKYKVDYNAAMLFENGENTAIYRKLHLVPFTEHFPYQKQLPWMYQMLKDADTHFWEKGSEATVFKGPGFNFSTPICFEDIFGYLSRDFVRAGADVIVNISNDAWSNSLPAQNQHLSMAIFRAVENNRSMVRSTASGQTCAVDPNGRVIAESAPFKENWLNAAVPLAAETTIYTLYGDYLGIFFVFAAVIFLLFGALWCIIRKPKSSKKAEGIT